MRRLPRLWLLLGVWYCGVPHPIVRVPIPPVFGSGSTPAEAYADWVRTKWRTGRTTVRIHRNRQQLLCDDIIEVEAAPAPPTVWQRLRAWLMGQ